ncbi:MAG: metal-dependent transcriptional regulator [Candidatus Thermoplasmatota archaeon]|nr:metal-dependent transcriptional regulator [Candidatus Thermoplasmatota archaeon]
MSEEVTKVDIDEGLEILWTLEEEGKKDKESFERRFSESTGGKDHRKRFRHGYKKKVSEQVLNTLVEKDFAEVAGDEIKLTEKGRDKAREIVRRHRLAERLFRDLLDMGKEEIEKPACEFEHLLSEEVTDQICTLLGHPRECPHGLPIPKGECCTSGKKTVEPAIMPLSKAPTGEEVEVAYITTESHPRLHKLLSYDIGPGSKIKLHQKEPVYVIKSGETDIALEEEIIKDIFVKKL